MSCVCEDGGILGLPPEGDGDGLLIRGEGKRKGREGGVTGRKT